MKKQLLTFACAVLAQAGAFAQTLTFSQSQGTYANLASPTVLSAAGWDEDYYPVAMPFAFSVGGNTVTGLEIDDNGYVGIETSGNIAWVDGMYADLMEGASGVSTVGYEISGTAGSQIMKIEWRNAGFYEGTPNEFANFQVWLYEGSNTIEVHYGPANITSLTDIFPAGGPDVGVITNYDLLNDLYDGLYLEGSGTAPTPVVLTGAVTYPSLSSVPPANQIFTFSVSGTTGIAKSLNDAAVSVYPNPATDVVTVKGFAANGAATVKITNVLGKTVLTQTLAANHTVNLSNLPKGAYMLEVSAGGRRVAKRITKL